MAQNMGESLRLFRAKVGLTQAEMAARLGCERARYAQWERDASMPPLEFRIKLGELGMNAIYGVAETRAFPYVADDYAVIQILIETLYDCSRPVAMRQSARTALYRKLEVTAPEDF